MVAIEGQFTFTAERPQLNCAVFFIGEPSDIISIEYDSVNIDCRGGDFIKVKCSHMHTHNSSPIQLTSMLFCSLEHKKECKVVQTLTLLYRTAGVFMWISVPCLSCESYTISQVKSGHQKIT